MKKQHTKLAKLITEGIEHKRIQNCLTKFAEENGFTEEVNFRSGLNPDVLHLKKNGQIRSLFMGDAKNAANETPGNSDTTDRFSKYISEFVWCLQNEEIDDGIIAVATNTYEAAMQWQEWLNNECAKVGLIDPSFEIKEIESKTYTIYW